MFISDKESLKLDQTKTICILMSRDFILCSASIHTRYHFDLNRHPIRKIIACFESIESQWRINLRMQ